MNWTRHSRIRIATPRLDDSDEASSTLLVDRALGYVSADMTAVSFRLCVFGGKTRGVAET
jgi:hypothetical protein